MRKNIVTFTDVKKSYYLGESEIEALESLNHYALKVHRLSIS